MLTNELKKGDKVRLRNGWDATIEDNGRGNTRLCTVYGLVTEMGSVYSHDIVGYYKDSNALRIGVVREVCPLVKVEHTDKQLKVRQQVKDFGF